VWAVPGLSFFFYQVAFTKKWLPVRLQMFGRKPPIKATSVAFRCLLLFLTSPGFLFVKENTTFPAGAEPAGQVTDVNATKH
jgi:hypothetical protein